MTPTHSLLLFDVDGVLIHPVGYKVALRATVGHFLALMGQPDYAPTEDEIAIFEACGITNEWDSGAICVAALLSDALAAHPVLRRATLDETLAAIRAAGLRLERPDYAALARRVLDATPDDAKDVPAARYLALLSQPAADHLPLLSALLADVYALETPTTRIFQTHTLGSARYAATYGEPAPLERESALAAYDRPLLAPDTRDRLLAWQAQSGQAAVIFTARPSLPPVGAEHGRAHVYAPEAELALELLGLDGQFPLIAQGRVGWLAQQRGRSAAEYVKPSPVQALAAVGAAISGDEPASLLAAAALAEDGRLEGPLADLRGQRVDVTVFEDAAGGIRATQAAVRLLQGAGLDVRARAIGVSPHPDKRAALTTVAEQVVDDVNAGLALVWDGAG